MRFPPRTTLLLAFVLLIGATARTANGQSAQARVDELLAADRAFATGAAGTDLVTAISAMFADEVIMPTPQRRLAKGKADAVAALMSNPANARSHVSWTPVRGGVSGDGLHGFTFGLMTVTRADGTTAGVKYLAYWTKGTAGWRVAGYKRVVRGAGEPSTAMMAPWLPAQVVAPLADVAAIERHRASLIGAEKGFSDLAQKIGLGPAFRETGAPDAINLGGAASAGFFVGNEAIAKLVQGDASITDGQVHWSADTAFVASSGDLGITFGFIHSNGTPPAGAPTGGSPFFTIWCRAGPGAPWRYIAE